MRQNNKKCEKKCDFKVAIKPKLSQIEREVLHLMVTDFLTPKQVSIRRKRSISSVYRIIAKLKKKGVYNGLTKKCDFFEPTFPPFLNGIRLHGQEFHVEILYKDTKYKTLLDKSNLQEYDGNTIKLYRDSLEIYLNKSFYGDDVTKATSKSIHYFNHFLCKLENHYNVILKKSRSNNIKQVNAHYAEINNGLAKDYHVNGEKLRIYTKEDGKLWFLIDNSFNLHEAESVHPQTSYQDMDKVKEFFNNIRDKGHFKPSEVVNVIYELASVQVNTQNQLNQLVSLLIPAEIPIELKDKKLTNYFG